MTRQEFNRLLRLAGAGCPQAMEALYREFFGKICSVALIMTHSTADAEDIAMDVMIKIFRAAAGKEFAEVVQPAAWIAAITRNTARNLLKRRARSVCAESVLCTADASEPVSITDLLEPLRQEERALVVLHFFWGYQLTEIAQMQAVSYSTVKRRFRRAKQKLGENLSN